MLSVRYLSVLSVGDVRTLWPNGWMDEDATWYGRRPPRRPHCIRRVPIAPVKGHMSTVATVAHLSYCWALVSCWVDFSDCVDLLI